jgi:hypothetical protein
VFAFLVASAIMTTLLYALLFQVRSEIKESCERGNTLRAEVSERQAPIRDTISVLISTRLDGVIALNSVGTPEEERAREVALAEVRKLRRDRAEVKPIAQVDCNEAVGKPWPFG